MRRFIHVDPLKRKSGWTWCNHQVLGVGMCVEDEKMGVNVRSL